MISRKFKNRTSLTPLCKYQRAHLLGHVIDNVQLCKKLPNCLPKRLSPFAFPPATSDSTCCATSLPALGLVSVLDFSCSLDVYPG